jgi:uncharacterized protein (UPF0335 family)
MVGEGEKMAVQNARISTKDLDARLLVVEEKLSAIVEQLSRLEHATQDRSAKTAMPNGGGSDHTGVSDAGRLVELEAQVSRIDERIEKIASTLVEQASRMA